MRKVVFFVLMMAVVAGAGSCAKSNTSQACDYDACSVKAPDAEVSQLEQYLAGAGINAVKHCSGMYYQVKTAGSGISPTPCSYVSVYYKGYLTNGTIFDQTTGTTAASFPLATLIAGWKAGMPLIQKGGVITLFIPPTLGYGAQEQKDRNGNVVIPANSIIIFDIQLLDTQ